MALAPSRRAAAVPSFKVMDCVARAAALEREGKHIYHLEVGQPQSTAPKHATEAVTAAIASGDKLGYTPACGEMPLRQAIVDTYKKTYDVIVPVEQVHVTIGSSAGFTLSFLAAFDVDDAVAIPSCSYPCYRNILQALGVVVVPVETNAEFKMDAAALRSCAQLCKIEARWLISRHSAQSRGQVAAQLDARNWTAATGRPQLDARNWTPATGRPQLDARNWTPATGRPQLDARHTTPRIRRSWLLVSFVIESDLSAYPSSQPEQSSATKERSLPWCSLLCLPKSPVKARARQRIKASFRAQERANANLAPLKGLILSSPANPTGAMLSADEMRDLCVACEELEILFCSDEIYHGISYTGSPRAATALEFSPKALVINSFSKFYSMTGWRIGWLVAPPHLSEPINRLNQNLFISAPAASQRAALAALQPQAEAELKAHVARYEQNREIVLGALKQMGISDVAPADGAFYVYVDLGAHGVTDSAALCASLLEEVGVALTPGIDFEFPGTGRGERRLRISFCGATAEIKAGMEKFAEWWAQYTSKRTTIS